MDRSRHINIQVLEQLPYKAETVWALIADFGNISWTGADNVAIIGQGIGMIRRIRVPELEDAIDEVLESIDHENMRLSYSIPRGLPFPLEQYHASAQVRVLDENSCEVIWQSDCFRQQTLSQEQAEAMLGGVYQQLIGWIREWLSSN